MSKRKRRREILDLATRHGWRVARSSCGGAHLILEHGDGRTVIVGLNRSSPRTWKNVIADLRRQRFRKELRL